MTLIPRPKHCEPVATLPVIDFRKLQARERAECDRLQRACSEIGVFHLDLHDNPAFLSLWSELLRFSQAYFTQDLASKRQNDHRSELYGYEAVGTSAGLSAGFVNGYESLKFAYHAPAMAEAPLHGHIIERSQTIVQEFQHAAHDALMQVLDCVSGDDVLRLHRPGRPSRTNSVFLRYPRDAPHQAAGHNEHNDMGTLTLLLTLQWGLQIRDPVDRTWKYVAPSPTQATINVGDSLNYISEGRYLSALHRVTRINDGFQDDKYSIAFFLRPANDAEYKNSDGTLMTAETWHQIRTERKRLTAGVV